MKHETDIFDIAVIGAGAAGSMAAIRASESGKKVAVIERNSTIGKKILLTGKGRCNITNTASLDEFIEKFGQQGKFLRTAFSIFFNDDLTEFLKSNGLELISERQGRVFPKSNKALSVVGVLEKALKNNKVSIVSDTRVVNIEKSKDLFELKLSKAQKNKLRAKKVIISTGGASYRDTGSTGDGYKIAKRLGHKLVPLRACLVPLKTQEKWIRELQGLSLKNIRVTFSADNAKKIVSPVGALIFTHFGVSGPLILDLSAEITLLLTHAKKISIFIDLKPALDRENLDKRLLSEFKTNGSAKLKNIMKNLLPSKLIPVFLNLSRIDSDKFGNQITQKDRLRIIGLLKEFPMVIDSSLPINRGMVTGGGISTKEINPRTMESRIIPGLYFAGEIIDGVAPSGGYNLQKAFSTGYLAGESAAIDTVSTSQFQPPRLKNF